jgi:hypothetical protein
VTGHGTDGAVGSVALLQLWIWAQRLTILSDIVCYFPRYLSGRLWKNIAHYAITTVDTRVPCTLCSKRGSATPCIYIGKWRYRPTFLCFSKMEMSGELHAPVTSPLREIALGTHRIGGWVGPRASLGAVNKRKIFCPCWGSNCNCPTHSLTILTELSQRLHFELCHVKTVLSISVNVSPGHTVSLSGIVMQHIGYTAILCLLVCIIWMNGTVTVSWTQSVMYQHAMNLKFLDAASRFCTVKQWPTYEKYHEPDIRIYIVPICYYTAECLILNWIT